MPIAHCINNSIGKRLFSCCSNDLMLMTYDDDPVDVWINNCEAGPITIERVGGEQPRQWVHQCRNRLIAEIIPNDNQNSECARSVILVRGKLCLGRDKEIFHRVISWKSCLPRIGELTR